MFHINEGLYFEKLPDGSVRIVKRSGNEPESPVIFDHVLDAGQWASVVAAMSGTLAEGAHVDFQPITD